MTAAVIITNPAGSLYLLSVDTELEDEDGQYVLLSSEKLGPGQSSMHHVYPTKRVVVSEYALANHSVEAGAFLDKEEETLSR